MRFWAVSVATPEMMWLLAAERLMEDTASLEGEAREEVERAWSQAVSVARAIYSLGAAPASPEVE